MRQLFENRIHIIGHAVKILLYFLFTQPCQLRENANILRFSVVIQTNLHNGGVGVDCRTLCFIVGQAGEQLDRVGDRIGFQSSLSGLQDSRYRVGFGKFRDKFLILRLVITVLAKIGLKPFNGVVCRQIVFIHAVFRPATTDVERDFVARVIGFACEFHKLRCEQDLVRSFWVMSLGKRASVAVFKAVFAYADQLDKGLVGGFAVKFRHADRRLFIDSLHTTVLAQIVRGVFIKRAGQLDCPVSALVDGGVEQRLSAAADNAGHDRHQRGGKDDADDRDDRADAVAFEVEQGELLHGGHTHTSSSLPSRIRMMRSASLAISRLCVIMTMV